MAYCILFHCIQKLTVLQVHQKTILYQQQDNRHQFLLCATVHNPSNTSDSDMFWHTYNYHSTCQLICLDSYTLVIFRLFIRTLKAWKWRKMWMTRIKPGCTSGWKTKYSTVRRVPVGTEMLPALTGRCGHPTSLTIGGSPEQLTWTIINVFRSVPHIPFELEDNDIT